MKSLQSVSVFGLGKLGSCIAATLAERGFEVLGVDVDPEKVNKVNSGEAPVDETLPAQRKRGADAKRANPQAAAASGQPPLRSGFPTAAAA